MFSNRKAELPDARTTATQAQESTRWTDEKACGSGTGAAHGCGCGNRDYDRERDATPPAHFAAPGGDGQSQCRRHANIRQQNTRRLRHGGQIVADCHVPARGSIERRQADDIIRREHQRVARVD